MSIDTEETTDFRGRKGSIRIFRSHPFDRLAGLPDPLYLGLDIGRDHDLSVIWVAARQATVLFPVAIVEMANVEFSRQEKELNAYLELPNMRRGCLDNTGLGKQFCERAQQRWGEYRVEPITFTQPLKEALAYPLRSAFEDRSLRCPDDEKIEADLRAVKKTTTEAGNIRFAADHGKNGHADRFWAAALCVHAAQQQTTGRVEVLTAGHREQTESMRDYGNMPSLSRY